VNPFDNLVKECQEEAGIKPDLISQARSAGSISTCHYCVERGITPETEYVFDLELPVSFVPTPQDGEVESFHLMSVQKVRLWRVLVLLRLTLERVGQRAFTQLGVYTGSWRRYA
jgi:8-oxo-dGTP pyrophosphatase MutT (NUDIX family)